MPSFVRRCSGGLLVLLLVAPLALAEEARDWLQRMTSASQQHGYQGSFVYERAGHFTTHHIWRQVTDQGVVERMVRTDGPAHEWLRQNGMLVCASSLEVASSIGTGSRVNEQTALLHNWYVLQVLGQTRVAARPAVVVSLQPRDAFRYAYELYLDSETGLLLKSLLINERDTLMERFQFTTLDYSPLDPSALEPGSTCLPLLETRAHAPEQPVAVSAGWLPPGFTLAYEHASPGDDNGLLTQVYTDGLARFSIFIEPLLQQDQADDLRAQLGPTVAVSRTVQTPQNDYLATVVGELPAAAAERIANALEGGMP
ncbi:MucB/RseB C-terminal domain-containing protein [Halopseudomonas salegens]|uniref:Sigma E regulatory protein, MucB/RseB n=1 Tax=Halopseudomonas salegens TaxID=1434072 RepID=A0A1H2EEC8_9GAMM|nr:MucB/RseB C-terminal domain-containing protein [Halopseudomonas salegens]SDT93450.1 sigma E regulatory protein, MucB/RseB [Halopseudomonas salegens]